MSLSNRAIRNSPPIIRKSTEGKQEGEELRMEDVQKALTWITKRLDSYNEKSLSGTHLTLEQLDLVIDAIEKNQTEFKKSFNVVNCIPSIKENFHLHIRLLDFRMALTIIPSIADTLKDNDLKFAAEELIETLKITTPTQSDFIAQLLSKAHKERITDPMIIEKYIEKGLNEFHSLNSIYNYCASPSEELNDLLDFQTSFSNMRINF